MVAGLYSQGPVDDTASGPSRAALAVSLAVHVAFFTVIALVSACKSSAPEPELVPIDMTIVLPPDPAEEEPEPPKPPKPPKEEPPPQLDDKLDAVEKVVEPPKPPEKSKPKEEEKPKPEEKKWKPVKIKGPDPKNKRKGEKKTERRNVPTSSIQPKGPVLSDAEIRRALAMGARAGSENVLPKNETQQCISAIRNACFREWDREGFNWFAGLKPGRVQINLKSNGAVAGWKLVSSTGSSEVDGTIKRAMARVKTVAVTPAFVKEYPSVTVEFAPMGN